MILSTKNNTIYTLVCFFLVFFLNEKNERINLLSKVISMVDLGIPKSTA